MWLRPEPHEVTEQHRVVTAVRAPTETRWRRRRPQHRDAAVGVPLEGRMRVGIRAALGHQRKHLALNAPRGPPAALPRPKTAPTEPRRTVVAAGGVSPSRRQGGPQRGRRTEGEARGRRTPAQGHCEPRRQPWRSFGGRRLPCGYRQQESEDSSQHQSMSATGGDARDGRCPDPVSTEQGSVAQHLAWRLDRRPGLGSHPRASPEEPCPKPETQS
jgi:hypothetical protein